MQKDIEIAVHSLPTYAKRYGGDRLRMVRHRRNDYEAWWGNCVANYNVRFYAHSAEGARRKLVKYIAAMHQLDTEFMRDRNP